MSRQLIVVGGGEHGAVVIEAALHDTLAWTVLGYLDTQRQSRIETRFGLPWLGSDEAIGTYSNASMILGFGALPGSSARVDASDRLDAQVATWGTVVHDRAWVSPTATIGPGTVVMAGAVVQTGARIGAHVIVNTGAIIEHDVIVEDHVQISPGVAIGGGTVIGRNAYVGIGASIRDHIRVGDRAVIGMGSAVVKDLSPETVFIERRSR